MVKSAHKQLVSPPGKNATGAISLLRRSKKRAAGDPYRKIEGYKGLSPMFNGEKPKYRKGEGIAHKIELPDGGNVSALPRTFDWRNHLEDVAPLGLDDFGYEFDQGACGSCYAFAATLAFQMRLRIALFREHGVLAPIELSWRAPTKCSPFTEGCDGGFSYLTFKQFKEAGAPEASVECDGESRSLTSEKLGTSCAAIPHCYSRQNPRIFYAKDYGYVGGFSQGSSEELIMQQLWQHGPLVLGIAVDAVPGFYWGGGGKTMKIYANEKIPREPAPKNKKIQPWLWTTHAIVAMGWGEEVDPEGMEPPLKYWVVRNSWGEDWGKGGYTQLRRGRNDAGLELEAEWVIPDLDRLPPGFLEDQFQTTFPARFGYQGRGKLKVVKPAKVQFH